MHRTWLRSIVACLAACALPAAAVHASPPVCNRTVLECTPCTLSDNGQPDGCDGPTPYCETNEESPGFGACVQCVQNSECAGATPVCTRYGPAADNCAACAADADCAGSADGPSCLASGACGIKPAGGGCANASEPGSWLAMLLLFRLAWARRQNR